MVERDNRTVEARGSIPLSSTGEAILRLVKMPAEWTFSDGRTGTGTGHLEYHVLMRDGVPVGLHE